MSSPCWRRGSPARWAAPARWLPSAGPQRFPLGWSRGFEIKRSKDVHPQTWVEVLAGDRWEPYDPDNGYARELPHHFVPVRREGPLTEGIDIIRSAERQRPGDDVCDRPDHAAGRLLRPAATPSPGHSRSDSVADPDARGGVLDSVIAIGRSGDGIRPHDHRTADLRHLHAHAFGPELCLQRLARA